MGRFFDMMKKYSLNTPDPGEEFPSRVENAAEQEGIETRQIKELNRGSPVPMNAQTQNTPPNADEAKGKRSRESFGETSDGRPQQSNSTVWRFDDSVSEKQVVAYRAVSEKFSVLREKYAKGDFRWIGPSKALSEKKAKNELIAVEQPESTISESFKVIRTRLLYVMRERRVQTVLVTSCNPGEGKSFVSSNIAISIAKGFDEYVLLVDADLRKPSLHMIYEVPLNPGLTDFLTESDNELGDVIIRTDIGKLSLLTAGSMYDGSSELLDSDLMGMFMQGLKIKYDNGYVILDSPPLLISEALALSHKVDGIIMVVDARRTSKDIVRRTMQLICKDKLLGIIMNNCDFAMKNYRYYGSIYKSPYYKQYRANLKQQGQSLKGIRK
jgi:exopolysaccharide/PEP-CTERM locus tyrosine autokinase